MKFKAVLLSCFTFFVSLCAFAGPGVGDDVVRKTDIAGGVFHNDTKKPLNSVTVTAYNASKKEKVVVSDVNGNFSFDDLKPGTYKFVFEKDGFKKVTREKTIARPDEAQQLNIMMEEHSAFDFAPGLSHFFEF